MNLRLLVNLYGPLWLAEKLEPHWRRKDYQQWAKKENWYPTVGTLVEDCRYKIQKIIEQDHNDPDTVRLEDGSYCSLRHCCNKPEINTCGVGWPE